MMRVKICGITNGEDAAMAVRLGADALGFIFAPSPRQIEPERAKSIIGTLPPFVHVIGVFVNEDPAVINEVTRFCGLGLIQLHGDEPPEICEHFMPRTIKAFRIRAESSLQSIDPYRDKVRALLFDTYAEGKRGGTGKTFDWQLARKGKEMGIPIILAGGLTPFNVGKAISTVKPFAVDVNSGVEERPGKKNPMLVKRLMENIRNLHIEGQTDD